MQTKFTHCGVAFMEKEGEVHFCQARVKCGKFHQTRKHRVQIGIQVHLQKEGGRWADPREACKENGILRGPFSRAYRLFKGGQFAPVERGEGSSSFK